MLAEATEFRICGHEHKHQEAAATGGHGRHDHDGQERDHRHDHSTITATAMAYSMRSARHSFRTATTPPTASTMPWSPVPPESGR